MLDTWYTLNQRKQLLGLHEPVFFFFFWQNVSIHVIRVLWDDILSDGGVFYSAKVSSPSKTCKNP